MGSQETPIRKEDTEIEQIVSNSELINEEELRIIEWEDFENDLVRLWSLVSTRNKAKARREALSQRLEAILEWRCHMMNRCADNFFPGQMRLKQCGRSSIHRNGDLKMQCCCSSRHLKRFGPNVSSFYLRYGHFWGLPKPCLLLGDDYRLLAGDGGYGHLRHLQKMLSTRQQLMVAQVASFYPLAHYPSQRALAEESDSMSPQRNVSGECPASSSVIGSGDSMVESLTIAGLQLIAPPLKKSGFFNDKQEYQSSATALGYVAHVVKLIASYLDIPLRYPVRLGGSRSYIQDYAPSVEPPITDSATAFGVGGSQRPIVEFPLFLEGQEPTRSAYAVFLLNKDLEQMLNYIGVQGVGPRHALPNLKRLINAIQSQKFLVSRHTM